MATHQTELEQEQDKPEVLTEDEEETLLRQLADGQGGWFTEEDAVAVFKWAGESRLAAILLGLTLEGKLSLKVEDSEIYFMNSEDKPQ